MTPSFFTIQFADHMTLGDQRDILFSVTNTGATHEQQSSHVARILCTTPKQLQHVGYILFARQREQHYAVIGVGGEAQMRASAYKDIHPPRT